MIPDLADLPGVDDRPVPAPLEALVGAIDLTGVERLVDVGGGRGALLATLLEANPGLRGVLYDRQEVASTAEALAAAEIADRAEAVGGDFFDSVPDGADRYVLKFVIHDWDDGRAIRILDSVRRAIPPHGLLLLIEHLLPEGDGYDHAVWLDLNMLVLTDRGPRADRRGVPGPARPGRLPADPRPPDVRPHDRDRGRPGSVGSVPHLAIAPSPALRARLYRGVTPRGGTRRHARSESRSHLGRRSRGR